MPCACYEGDVYFAAKGGTKAFFGRAEITRESYITYKRFSKIELSVLANSRGRPWPGACEGPIVMNERGGFHVQR